MLQKILQSKLITVFGWIVALLCLATSFGLAQAHADTPGHGQRLVTIHDGVLTRSVVTEDRTLRQVLDQAHIFIGQNDLVEPGLDQPLISNNYQVNIYRARPVVIVDGMSTTRVMSPYQTPKDIATHAGVSLRPEDGTTLSASQNIISDGAALQLTVERAVPITFVQYGTSATVYTRAKTVSDFLKEEHISVQPKDTLSQPLNAVIVAGMDLELWRNGTQTVTQKEAINFNTQTIQDADQPQGYQQIQTPGQNGEKMVTYEITMQDGHEIGRKVLQSTTIQNPVTEVVVVGVKVSLPLGSHEDWMSQAGIAAGNYGYVNYIFSHESGWNPAAVSPAGYVGLGQTSRANLSRACPSWQSDPVCQINFFNGYAVSRYGSWANAYDFKASNGWW